MTRIKQMHQKNVSFVIRYFKDLGFNFEPHVCSRCHDVLLTPYELKNIAILNLKGLDFTCILSGISRDEAVKADLFCVRR